MSSRLALLRHLWAMIQTRAEAAGLVVQLQRTAVTQGLLYYGIAAVTGLAFMTAVIVWIAVAAPPSWRGWALGIVSLALLATAIFSAVTAGKKIARDTSLIADFSRGLKLDLAMVNLALKDPDTEDEDKLAERERAKDKVREAAADKAATPSTAEGGVTSSPDGPSVESAEAAMRAAAPRPDVSPAGRAAADVGAPMPTGGPSAAAGYATTVGGAYAATSSAASSPVTERERPDEVAGPEDLSTAARAVDGTERRRQHHGSS